MNATTYELDALSTGWDPFSRETALWHGCPGHDWERIDFDLSRGRGSARVERITRCANCGAPRCDAYNAAAFRALGHGLWENLPDLHRQAYRCTYERHHDQPHDYLDGSHIEVGS